MPGGLLPSALLATAFSGPRARTGATFPLHPQALGHARYSPEGGAQADLRMGVGNCACRSSLASMPTSTSQSFSKCYGLQIRQQEPTYERMCDLLCSSQTCANGDGERCVLELVIACDGGCSFGSGRHTVATYAFVAYVERGILRQQSGIVCRGRWANSLVAEYGGVVAALRWASQLPMPGPTRIRVLSDCISLIQRLTGQCTVQNWHGYRSLHRAAVTAASKLRRRDCQVLLEHVHRREVAAAHHMCTLVYRREHTLPIEPRSGPDSISGFLRSTWPPSL